MLHCQLIQAGDIQAVIGDASRDGMGGTQYCGVWSLTSKHRAFNAFGNSYAGLLPGPLRGRAPTLAVIDDNTVALSRQADGTRASETRATYRIAPPNIIDHTLEFRDCADLRGAGCDFREVSWCSYMNSPEDIRLHFLSGGDWRSYNSPEHGVASNIAPAYLTEDELERWPERTPHPFHWGRCDFGFDQPFYYGRQGAMVLIFIFDTPRWLRFFCSPSGGGPSVLAGLTSPAWDFEWVIPAADYEVGRTYSLRTRLVYKPFVSNDDVLAEYERAVAELGFETV